MPNKHLKYGGSTIARTLECSGWAKLADSIPRVEEGWGSDAAELGTALHEAMEFLVENNEDAIEIEGMYFNGFTIDHEMVEESLTPALNALDELFRHTAPDHVLIEPFVEIIPNLAGGSIDLLARKGKTVYVIDYKFGHMPVPVENNKQLLFYALCADADPQTQHFFEDAENLVLAIIQPHHPDGALQKWATSLGSLDYFEEDVAKAVGEAEGSTPSFKAGDHCRYCPALAVCPIKTGEADKAARLPQVHVDKLEEYLPLLGDIEDWIKEVRALAQRHLEKGGHVKGFKLVNKRPTRVWTNEAEVEAMVKNMRSVTKADTHTTKLNSPAQMEKLFKKKGIDPSKITDYVSSVSSGLTLAPESDKREAALPAAALKAALNRLD